MATLLSPNSHHRVYSREGNITNQVFSIISKRSGQIRAADLDKIFRNKNQVRSAITRLTLERRIKRIKGFGKGRGIEYFYVIVDSDQSSSKTIEARVPISR